MPAVAQDDGFHVILVDGTLRGTDCQGSGVRLKSLHDKPLVFQRKLLIGDNGREEDGMGCAAFRTSQALDPEDKGAVSRVYLSFVIAMDIQAGGTAAGAGEAVELQAVYNGIIKIL